MIQRNDAHLENPHCVLDRRHIEKKPTPIIPWQILILPLLENYRLSVHGQELLETLTQPLKELTGEKSCLMTYSQDLPSG
jgi:hypothetical protein